ncbi:tRNA (adenosine(37)-N6)-dimethylallyltransferase MiaA [Candidatus Falkowbacteria bacterium]|nr:tRNA (adenosine(37)-N6)-dimethylallyltransferase MiaA [Candidatus Falkowbacteria bacterium]
MTQIPNKIIVVLGPTATGKTRLGVRIASKFSGEIISADSRQVYKGMDIGTGKDLAEFSISKNIKVPYHLIDVVSPKTEFNAAKWLVMAKKAIADIHKRGKVPIIVGGTGLYISALVEGFNLAGAKPDKALRKKLEATPLARLLTRLKKLDPETYKKIDKKNKRRVVRAVEICLIGKEKASKLRRVERPDFDFLILGIKKEREEINKLIDRRADKWMKQGIINEVKRLRKQGISWKRLDSFGLEYRWVSKFLQGEVGQDEMLGKMKTSIHQFAKRQMVWFRKMRNVKWVKNYQEASKTVAGFLKS